LSDRSPPKRRLGWILIDAPFAAGRLVKQNSSVRPFDEHASSTERPKSLTKSWPKPSLVSALSRPPKRPRVARTRSTGRQSASSGGLPRQSVDTKSVGSSPRLTGPYGPMSRDQTRLRLASRRSRDVEPSRGCPRSDSSSTLVAPTVTGLRFSSRALDFRALLRVWFGYDPSSFPTRDRPVLPWVSSSPPRHSGFFATRSPWPVSSARAAELVVRGCRHLRLTVMGSTAGGPTSRHPSRLDFPVSLPRPGKRYRRDPPPKRESTKEAGSSLSEDSVALFDSALQRERTRGQSRPSWGL
jgi:hypothetical protein